MEVTVRNKKGEWVTYPDIEEHIEYMKKQNEELLEALERFYNHATGKVDDFQSILHQAEEAIKSAKE